jgi:hypothetical protein
MNEKCHIMLLKILIDRQTVSAHPFTFTSVCN